MNISDSITIVLKDGQDFTGILLGLDDVSTTIQSNGPLGSYEFIFMNTEIKYYKKKL